MSRYGLSLVVVALLSTGGLAGCIDWDWWDDYEDGPVTAKDTIFFTESNLDRHAESDLDLMGVYGLYFPTGSSNPLEQFDGVERAINKAGDLVHEGKLDKWGYVSHSKDGETYQQFTAEAHSSRGGRSSMWQAPGFLHEAAGARPLDVTGQWMDSDAALQQVAQMEPRTVQWLENGTADMMIVLQHLDHRETPHWAVMATPHDGHQSLQVIIDAVTGDPLAVDEVYTAPEILKGGDEMEIRANNEIHEFNVPSGYGAISVLMEPAGDPKPQTEVVGYLDIPTAGGIDKVPLEGDWPGPLQVRTFLPHAGEYEISAFARTLVINFGTEDVRVTWCLDGVQPDPLGVVARGECL